jgi:ubiquinone/menaquinone biosynthesis C-methylase UbiE
VKTRDAVELIAAAVPRGDNGTWLDIGAGSGTFTLALLELLGSDARIYAIDRDATALAGLSLPASTRDRVTFLVADFTQPFELPNGDDAEADGMLIANALHFARDQADVLARLSARLKPGGRMVIVEYDQRGPSPWVPFPVTPSELARVAKTAGLTPPEVTATRPSAYGGTIYVAMMRRQP